jgi:hypothetical protein
VGWNALGGDTHTGLSLVTILGVQHDKEGGFTGGDSSCC